MFWYTVYEITTSSQFLISNLGPFGGCNPFSRKNSSLLILFLDEINSVDIQANNLQRHALIKEGSRFSAANSTKEPSLSPASPCTSFLYPLLSHSVPLMQVKNGNSDRKLQSYKLYAIHVLKYINSGTSHQLWKIIQPFKPKNQNPVMNKSSCSALASIDSPCSLAKCSKQIKQKLVERSFSSSGR